MRGFQNGLIFLNLVKRFRRYLDFSAQKNGFFRQAFRRKLHILNGAKKKIFEGFFAFFWE